MTVSWRLHYLWNAKNEDPFGGAGEARAKQAIHGNFAVVLGIGVNGYFFR